MPPPTLSSPDTPSQTLPLKNGSDARLIRYATLAYIAALSLIAMLSGATHFVLDHSISEQSDSATIVNISGRQRMLSQRIAFLATEIQNGDDMARQELRHAADSLARSHNALINGNALGIKHSLSENGRALYFSGASAIDTQIATFLRNAEVVLEGAKTPATQQAVLDIKNAARNELLPTFDAATNLFSQEALERVNEMQSLQRLVLAILIITLIAEAFLIFRPLINTLNSYVLRLYDGATRDSLTGLPNRRFYMDASHKEMNLAVRRQTSLSVITFDIDYFKIINDTHGHAVGDSALKAFAVVFRDALRSTEIFGRIGGEEFAVTLQGADVFVAAGVAERVRAAVENHTQDHLPRFTVSCGVAQLADGETFEALLQRADDQLYVAKHNGRNQVSLDQQTRQEDAAQEVDTAFAF